MWELASVNLMCILIKEQKGQLGVPGCVSAPTGGGSADQWRPPCCPALLLSNHLIYCPPPRVPWAESSLTSRNRTSLAGLFLTLLSQFARTNRSRDLGRQGTRPFHEGSRHALPRGQTPGGKRGSSPLLPTAVCHCYSARVTTGGLLPTHRSVLCSRAQSCLTKCERHLHLSMWEATRVKYNFHTY